MLERVEESGLLQTTLEQRFQALRCAALAKDVERGRAQGLERELPVRLAGRKSGPDVAVHVARLPAGISDPDRLQDVGWPGRWRSVGSCRGVPLRIATCSSAARADGFLRLPVEDNGRRRR